MCHPWEEQHPAPASPPVIPDSGDAGQRCGKGRVKGGEVVKLG